MAQPDLEQNIVYKVVRPEGNSLFSVLTDHPKWKVLYASGKATKPNYRYSPLFAFRDLEAAIRWASTGNHIWKAHAEGIRNPLPRIPETNYTGMYKGFWTNRWLHLPQIVAHYGAPPLGTVFCSSITLLERVTP